MEQDRKMLIEYDEGGLTSRINLGILKLIR